MNFLTGGGEMGSLMRAHDWSTSPVGDPEKWPQSLQTLVGVMLNSNQPMFVAWGPERTLLYNDAYAEILVKKHPGALGCDFLEVWSEIRNDLAPIVDQAYAGDPVHMDDITLVMERRGHLEETHFAFSYTPVRDPGGAVRGFFCPCLEITGQVLAERRQAFRLALEERLRDLVDPTQVVAAASEALGRHLGVGQIIYAEVEAGDNFVVIEREWNDGTIASNIGRHRLDDYGPEFISNLRQGRSTAIGDVRLDPRTSSPQALGAFARASISGLLNVPLIKADRLVAVLGVHSATPRAWSAEDVALAEEIAERTWAAVERARAEASLRDSDARLRESVIAAERKAAELRAVLESMPDAVYIGGTEGITLANRPALDQLGFSDLSELNRHVATLAEEIQTRHVETGAQSGLEDQAFTRAFSGERVVQDVRVRHRGNGEDRIVRCAAAPVVIDGQVIAAVAVNTDITEAKRAEAELRESEARLSRALDAGDLGAWELDLATLAAWRSPQHDRIFGYETMLAKWTFDIFLDHVVPEDREVVSAKFKAAVNGGERWDFEARIRRADGEQRWIWAQGRAEQSTHDQPGRMKGMVRDITHRKQIEEALHSLNETLESRVAERTAELEQAHEQLRQSQKLEAMGSLTGGVSHDFNNLLSPIIGSLDLLQRKGVGTERERRLIDGALQSAERARVLVQRLLAFARRQPLQPKPVDLGALVAGMADLIASTSGPQVKVVVDVAEGLPAALADPNQIEMAILNLAVNARDAMETGGTLRISAGEETVGTGHKSQLQTGHYVQLSVADTGTGMDETTLAKAIEPFFSTKGVGRGTGLGLSMAHGLASQLGGTLTIESKPGLGTNVVMWLPASNEAATRLDRAEDAAVPPTAGTALLVDDEELVRASTADMLSELGYFVVEAGSSEEALRLVDDRLAFDLLVTDHLMPGISGSELVREVRDRRPNAQVLIISGYAAVDGVAPDVPRLVKPFRKADRAGKLAELEEGFNG